MLGTCCDGLCRAFEGQSPGSVVGVCRSGCVEVSFFFFIYSLCVDVSAGGWHFG